MRNYIYILLASLFTVSCGELEVNTGPGPLVTTKDKSTVEINTDATSGIDFSDPSVFIGTDFGNYFQSMFERGEFKYMISFTSQQSIDKFGEEAILDHYKNMKFGYELGGAKSKSKIGNITTLNYNANINATKVVVRLDVIVENDSCKIVLPNNLSNFPI